MGGHRSPFRREWLPGTRYRCGRRPHRWWPAPATCRWGAHGGAGAGQVGAVRQLGETEVEDLPTPPGVSITLAGLMSRWTMPACAPPPPFGDLDGDGASLGDRQGAVRDAVLEGFAVTLPRRRTASVIGLTDLVDGADPRVVEPEAAWASRRKRFLASAFSPRSAGRNLSATLRPSLRSLAR